MNAFAEPAVATTRIATELLNPSPFSVSVYGDPAAETAALGKPEQQFGDTVIPPVDPDWNQVAEQATDLLRRSKDVRPAVLLLRTSTRRQGVTGFGLGMQLLTSLLERHWDAIHPQLDADDDNDPTMRLNALAPLSDESLVPRDLYDALIGNSRSLGPLRVRDVAVARNALAPVGDAGYSPTQVQGALEEILADDPDAAAALRAVAPAVTGLQNLLVERSGRSDAVDFSRLRSIGHDALDGSSAPGRTYLRTGQHGVVTRRRAGSPRSTSAPSRPSASRRCGARSCPASRPWRRSRPTTSGRPRAARSPR